ncbi:hypothetical protein PUNSTDRAFT_107355 [Punctularia strigosozonata HHB-11173 SS5]|uniref:Beta-glucuronidase C-terminal domain-containing protein n=1 Tax=Punctularia strigosozonata (strain HHB-11173) TaxID=741275 RepID=R7S3U9_PUNST|nr:uncharacterized protein PUNSTDRAFT_107355 [Punctularia strigosozonata HHB-11173 SS5]EIN05065.1 hypothetical protein PUNSTDRAFT_107355 [Punctularia strigosozonata HHB-11173 SS5]
MKHTDEASSSWPSLGVLSLLVSAFFFSVGPVYAATSGSELVPPPLPDPPLSNAFTVALSNSPNGLSIPQSGSFFGFSIELSVINQHLGRSTIKMKPQFLSLLDNVVRRAGSVHVRVGGNTQETATLVDRLPGGQIISKDNDVDDSSGATSTPPLFFTTEILNMMAKVSTLVNVNWYLGIPFNDTSDFRLQIAEKGQEILGNHLVGLQAGNEPDLYADHHLRGSTYGPSDYANDFGSVVSQLSGRNQQTLIGPSVSSRWTPEEVWDTGFISRFSANLGALSVERYYDTACTNVPHPRDAQTVFPNYLNHTAATSFVARYTPSTAVAQAAAKPFIMFETNTATCSGFEGVSDSFGAALWGLDYALQMAYGNFSHALFHIGGQDAFYNPFTPPSTPQSSDAGWLVGPIYYSALATAEALGSSNKSQVLDLHANNGSIYTPAYGIYEDGTPQRLALFNFITDPSGVSDYTAMVTGISEDQVKVKYLAASSVSQIGNFTWAGQTFGSGYVSNGVPQGDQDYQSVSCSGGNCQIKVPAPGFALVFLTPEAQDAADYSSSTPTFTSSSSGAPSATKKAHASGAESRYGLRTATFTMLVAAVCSVCMVFIF